MASSTEHRTSTAHPLPPRPYRTNLRAVDPAQLQAMSLADGRADATYRPYEEERDLIAQWRGRNSPPPASFVSRWACHPDERVRAELVRSGKTYFWINHTADSSEAVAWRDWKKAFLDRIVTDMRAEGVCWTPLLDEAVDLSWTLSTSIVEDVTEVLAPWLKTQATQHHVREMLHAFRGQTIGKIVLANAGCIDSTIAREIYENIPDTNLIKALARNPSLSPDVVAALAEWLVDDWEARIRDVSAIRNDSWDCLSALLQAHSSSVPPNLLRRVYALPKLANDLGVRTIDIEEYLHLRSTELVTREVALYQALYQIEWFSDRIATYNLHVPPDVLCAAVPFVRRKRDCLTALLYHPNADASVWHEVLKHTQVWEIHESAAHKPELYQDPEVRQRLLTSRNRKVPLILAQNADPQTAAEAVRHLIARGQLKRAAEALAARAPEKPIALEPADLKPLLQSNDQSIRLAGIAGLSRLRAQAQPTTNPKPLRSATAQRKNL